MQLKKEHLAPALRRLSERGEIFVPTVVNPSPSSPCASVQAASSSSAATTGVASTGRLPLPTASASISRVTVASFTKDFVSFAMVKFLRYAVEFML